MQSGQQDEFSQSLLDVFRLFGPVRLRRMFGGYGLFHDGLMFGLVLEGTLYLKADAQNVGMFTQLGLPCFTYARQGRSVGLSYYRAPESLFDDPEEAARWARQSFGAALRTSTHRQKTPTPARKGGSST